MSALVICLIFMLIAAAVIILVCVIAYNRRMDKVANGEVRDRHSRIPDPETAVNGTYRIVLMAIATISMISIGALSGMVSSLQSSISSLKSDYHRLYREFSDLQEQLEADRRLIADYHTEETLNEQEIRLEKGLDLEDDLTFRIEILTKSGFRIVNRSVMIYDASLDVEDVDFLKVLDAGGNVVWESE